MWGGRMSNWSIQSFPSPVWLDKVYPQPLSSSAFWVVSVARASGPSEVRPAANALITMVTSWTINGDTPDRRQDKQSRPCGGQVAREGLRSTCTGPGTGFNEPNLVSIIFWKWLLCVSISKCKALNLLFSYRSCGWRVPMSKWYKFVTSTSLATSKKCKYYVRLHC